MLQRRYVKKNIRYLLTKYRSEKSGERGRIGVVTLSHLPIGYGESYGVGMLQCEDQAVCLSLQ